MREGPRPDLELRRRAEERLRARLGVGGADGGAEDVVERLLVELEVHQVELEMQNEELTAAREQAEREGARNAALFEFAPTAYVSIDVSGTIRAANDAAVRLLGQERGRLVGGRLGFFVAPSDRARFNELAANALRAERAAPPSCELALVLDDRPSVDVRVTAAALPDGSEVLVAIEDLSVRRTAEELAALNTRLSASDRHKSEFLAVLSHELRNPLAPILAGVQLLARAPAESAAFGRARKIVARQTEHLSRLVDDLLDVTRIARGKIELRRARLDLRDVVRRTCEDHRALFEARRIALREEEAPAAAWVDIDATRMAQVVGNFLQNAARFGRPGGAVTVSVGATGASAEVRVRDDGVGIAPELLPAVFTPFVQGDDGLSRTKGGLGLGLALVKGLVELHGGTVRAHSEGPGLGAEFVVTLPRAPAPAAAASAHARPAVRLARILVIEDNADAAETLAELLRLDGHEVEVASGGRAGVAMARARTPDVVLCDLGLPDVEGYEVARLLRSDGALRATRLVALSGYAQPEDRERSRAAGFDAHLAKPPDLDELKRVLADRGDEAPRR